MPNVSKAEFARHLGVSKPRVSQYIADGLPVLGTGKIDLDVGAKWVSENVRWKAEHEGKGAPRAAQIVKRKPSLRVVSSQVTPPSSALDPQAVADALAMVLNDAGQVIARFAVAAGAPMRCAYALNLNVGTWLSTEIEKRIPAIKEVAADGEWPFSSATVSDAQRDAEAAWWARLAAKAGEAGDDDAQNAWSESTDQIDIFEPEDSL